MPRKNGCGTAYCNQCGKCLTKEEKQAYLDGYCLDCGYKLPPHASVCPKCQNYVQHYFFDERDT